MSIAEVETPYGEFTILRISYFEKVHIAKPRLDTVRCSGQSFDVYNVLDDHSPTKRCAPPYTRLVETA
jgi:hypothetical protein